jgi:hypothetical protein
MGVQKNASLQLKLFIRKETRSCTSKNAASTEVFSLGNVKDLGILTAVQTHTLVSTFMRGLKDTERLETK